MDIPDLEVKKISLHDKNHEEFGYRIILPIYSKFNGNVAKVCSGSDHINGYNDEFAFFEEGKHSIDGIEFYVCDLDLHIDGHNHKKYYFKSYEEYEKLNGKLNEIIDNEMKAVEFQLYTYNIRGHWQFKKSYSIITKENYFGNEDIIQKIEKDIINMSLYKQFLSSIGESKSFNYLLQGPPGTGKTSLIKLLASKYGYSVFEVNGNNIDLSALTNVLVPKVENSSDVKILLFEDFDRFLEKKDIVMSQILNILDGFDNDSNIIRFFTGNNCTIIHENDALKSRISAVFNFEKPTKEMLSQKFDRFASFYDNIDIDKRNKFIDMIVKYQITMRPFSNYIVRYLFEENWQDKLIDNISDLSGFIKSDETYVRPTQQAQQVMRYDDSDW